MPRPFSWRYWGWVEYTSMPLAIWWVHATASSMAWEATDVNDWFEWNGVRCTQYGIHVSELPPPTIPSERATYTNVPGRPGSSRRPGRGAPVWRSPAGGRYRPVSM